MSLSKQAIRTLREAYEMAKALEEDKRSWIKEKARRLLDNYEFDVQTMYVVRKSREGYFNVEDWGAI